MRVSRGRVWIGAAGDAASDVEVEASGILLRHAMKLVLARGRGLDAPCPALSFWIVGMSFRVLFHSHANKYMSMGYAEDERTAALTCVELPRTFLSFMNHRSKMSPTLQDFSHF